jgi:hypothetical protein
MPLLQIDVSELPDAPLDAAAEFYGRELPEIRDDLDALEGHDLVLVFEPAGHEHNAWRLAAIQELARELAPRRVNAIVGSEPKAILDAERFLDAAAGVTGQVLTVD